MRLNNEINALLLSMLLFHCCSIAAQNRCDTQSNKIFSKDHFLTSRTHTAEIKLPVAVHFHNLEELNPDDNCWSELAEGLVHRLNTDFNRENKELAPDWRFDLNNQSSVAAGNSMIKFQLAEYNHPHGANLRDGEKAVTYNLSPQVIQEIFQDYLNVNVGLYTSLGNSPTGGTGLDGGINIDIRATLRGFDCVGDELSSAYDLGRTLTHEVGHYFGLQHIWGEEESCSVDDGIEDTPLMASINYDCEDTYSCQSHDMTMNFMGYADDACMYMFTPMQCIYMRSYVLNNLQNMVNKGPQVFSPNPCPSPKNIIVNDYQGTINISWDNALADSTYLAYKPKDQTTWIEARVDTNIHQFQNTLYPITYEIVMYSTCRINQSKRQSGFRFQEISLQRPESFFIHDWFNIYPNPANERLNISVKLDTVGAFSNILSISYWNTHGQEEFFKRYLIEPGSSSSDISLDISHLHKGLYFLRLNISRYIKEVTFLKL